jgi:hypothetical protein
MIHLSNYKKKKSIVLENALIRAEFIPSPGGKLASFINKETGYEYLLQREGAMYLDQPYDGIFVDGECNGFDDMFPTIDACLYENEPWKDTKIPDHGEVWSLPWEYKIDTDSLCMSVRGVRFPYKLEKKIFISNPKSLRLEYSLTNYSPFDFEFLWAAHLMINMKEGTIVEVPDDCRQIVTVLTNGNRAFGDINNWPWLRDKDGNAYRADICRSKDAMGFEKYYFVDKLKEGWSKLKYSDKQNILNVSFPVAQVPYLGLLMNEGGWGGLYNMCIEPCTVCYDRPDVAKKHGQVSKVEAFGTYCWYLELSI